MAYLDDFPSLAVAVLLALITWKVAYEAFFSPLSSIPNAHWSAPFSRLWILFIRFSRQENRTLHAAHRRLGPILRVGPRELSINDLHSVRTVYQGGFDKTVWYSVFDNYGAPCMFSTRPMVEHSLRKRLISNVYSKSYIHASPAAAAQARDILFNRMLPILEDSISGPRSLSVIDIYSTFMATTMDFIACYIFGLRNGTDFLREKAYREHFLELYKARNDYGIYDQELPWLTKLCRRLGIPFCPKWVDSANKELGEWCLRLCNRLWDDAPAATTKDNDDDDTSPSPPSSSPSNPADQPVVWTALVSGLRKEEAKNGRSSLLFPTALSNFHLSVASELFDHVLAGQETAGVTLSYLAWRLSQRPDLQRQLREELLTLSPNLRFLANESRASPTPELPDPKHLDHLPLLHAVIMETLRLHAPLPGAEPRQTPPQGCRIGPYHVPGGVRVAAMPYMLHRDETVFPEPEKWDYTRWLPSGGATEEERKQQNRQFWAFSSGGRMCIGSNFAMHEMKLIIAAIYSNYTTHIVDDAGMENQSDGYAGRPEHERLFLRLERV